MNYYELVVDEAKILDVTSWNIYDSITNHQVREVVRCSQDDSGKIYQDDKGKWAISLEDEIDNITDIKTWLSTEVQKACKTFSLTIEELEKLNCVVCVHNTSKNTKKIGFVVPIPNGEKFGSINLLASAYTDNQIK